MRERGQLVASVPEVEWSAEEQGWMLAYLRHREDFCAQCGGDLEETTDSRTEEGYEYLPPVQCNRCVGFANARKAYEDQPNHMSLMHRIQLKPHVQRKLNDD